MYSKLSYYVLIELLEETSMKHTHMHMCMQKFIHLLTHVYMHSEGITKNEKNTMQIHRPRDSRKAGKRGL